MKKIIIMTLVALTAFPLATFAQKTTITKFNTQRTYKTETQNINYWYQGEVNLGFAKDGKYKLKEYIDNDCTDSESGNAESERIFIETVHGVRITQYAFVGLGVGFNYGDDLLDADCNYYIIPVFLNLKGYYPITSEVEVFASVDLGYNFIALVDDDESCNGFYATYGAGLKHRGITLSIGCQNPHIAAKDGEYKITTSISSFFFKIGYTF